MQNISLSTFARQMGSNSMLGIAKMASPPPSTPVSVRALVAQLGTPLAPVDLWITFNVGDPNTDHHPPDSHGVPVNNVQFNWNDPSNSAASKATSAEFFITITSTGKNFGISPYQMAVFSKSQSLGVGPFALNTSYTWSVMLSNAYGSGPMSPAYTFQTVAPAPPPVVPPQIKVSYIQPPASAQFNIAGTKFLPNHIVHIRIVNISNSALPTVYQNTNSDSTGAIKLDLKIPCLAGTVLAFSANDERPDSNVTGTLWSNTVQVNVA